MRAFRRVVTVFLVLALLGTVMPVFAGQTGGEEPRSAVDWRFQSSKPRPGSNPTYGAIVFPAEVSHPAAHVRLIVLLLETLCSGRFWFPVGW